MRRTRVHGIRVMLAMSLSLGLAGCGSTGGSATPTPSTAAPTTGDAIRGKQVFQSSDCTSCHLTTNVTVVGPGLAGVLAGKGPYGANLTNGKPITDQNVANLIKNGATGKIGTMPPHPQLSQQQLMDLVAYLKTLQ